MNVPSLGYSTPESKKFIEKDIKTMGKIFNNSSQQSIKIMMDGVKGGRYDANGYYSKYQIRSHKIQVRVLEIC